VIARARLKSGSPAALCLCALLAFRASAQDSEPPAPQPAPAPALDAGSQPAAADEHEEAPIPEVFHAVVAATREDAAITGGTATVVSRERLEELPGGDTQTVAQVVEMQPGTVADSFGSSIHVRGADGAILYVVDGIPMFAPAVGTKAQLLDTLPTRLVQNLQVFTGGFPVDYSYALGGVVNITTRRPAETPTGEVQLTYGSYNLTDLAANYSQSIGKLSIIASGDFVSTARGLDTPDAIDVLHDNRRGGNGFIKSDYQLDSKNRLSLVASYQQDHFQIPIDATMLPLSDAPPGATRGNDVYGNPSPQFVPYDANPTDTESTLFASLSYLHTGDVSTQVSLFERQVQESYDCDPAGSLGASADPGSVCSSFTRNAFHTGGLANASWHWLGGDWKAGVQLDDQHSTLRYSLFTRNDSSPSGGADPAATLAGGDNINTLSAGAFVEDRIELGALTLLPGFRFDTQSTNFRDSNEPSIFLSGPSGRLGASYAFNDRVLLHAFAGYLWESPVNYDAPVIAQILIPSLAGQTLPVDLKPATSWSTELGITVHPTGGLTVGLTGWGRWTHNMLDHQNIGASDLWASFNWDQGRAWGGDLYANGEIAKFASGRFVLEGFGNLSGQQAQQLDITTQQFLFGPDDIAASHAWSVMDHVQFWTVNVGLLFHDAAKNNNVSVHLNYGSGFHTGIATNETVPEHTTVDLTASHVFELPGRPELAFDAFNLFNDIYAYRLGTGFFGNSQYAALRHFDVRLIIHLG